MCLYTYIQVQLGFIKIHLVKPNYEGGLQVEDEGANDLIQSFCLILYTLFTCVENSSFLKAQQMQVVWFYTGEENEVQYLDFREACQKFKLDSMWK